MIRSIEAIVLVGAASLSCGGELVANRASLNDGGGSDAERAPWSSGDSAFDDTGTPRVLPPCPCAAGDYALTLKGDGAPIMYGGSFPAAEHACDSQTPAIDKDVCGAFQLSACESNSDRSRSCIAFPPYQGGAATYIDRIGQIWSLSSTAVEESGGDGAPSPERWGMTLPFDGSFKAVATRAGATLDLSGTFHACARFSAFHTCR